MRQIGSVWATTPPHLDGVIGKSEWFHAEAGRLQLNHGVLLAQNDASHLYLLIDLTQDTHDDPPRAEAPWGDLLALVFDVDMDRKITPNVDLQYGISATGAVGLQYYLEPGHFTLFKHTGAKIVGGFGKSMNSATPHRIWEVSIPLSEIKACPGRTVNIGLRTYSVQPQFDDSYPNDFLTSLSDLRQLTLAELVLPGIDSGSVIDVNPTTGAIQTGAIRRTILPDGSIEFRYPNGDVKRVSGGSIVIRHLDGTVSGQIAIQVQEAVPPAAPRGQLSTWLNAVNDALLDNISKILCNDQGAVDSYLGNRENGLTSVYARIAARTNFINQLSSEPVSCNR